MEDNQDSGLTSTSMSEPAGQPETNQLTGEQPPADKLQKLMQIANATNIDDAVKWAENVNSRLGKSITLPDEPDSEANRLIQEKLAARGYDVMLKPDLNDPEQLKYLHEILGKPKEPDEYKLPEPNEELNYDPSVAEKFKEVAYKHDLSQSQMEGVLVDLIAENQSKQAELQKAEYERLTNLKAKLGFAYDEKVGKAKELMKVINPEFDTNNATAAEIEGMIRLVDKIGDIGAEGVNFSRSPETTRRTPDEAKAEISKVMKELEGMPPSDPAYKGLMDKKRNLYKEAYPDQMEPDGTARVGGVRFA